MNTRQFCSFIIAMSALMAASCSSSDSWTDYEGIADTTSIPTPGGNTGTDESVDAGELTSFTIAIDTTAMEETETINADDEDYVENNTFKTTINITYEGASATVSGDDNHLVSVSGADVTITPTTKAIYVLSGKTADGSLRINDDDNAKKTQLQLNGVSITNSDGPAINIQSGKRTYIVANAGTTNTFTDGTTYASSKEDQKGTVFSEGELLFSGSGSIRVYSNTKHGIVSDDYIMTRPGTNIYVKSTSGSGLKCNETMRIHGGVINVETSADAAKGLTTDANYIQDGGRVVCITTGNGKYDSDDKDVSASAGLKADSAITINDGQLFCCSSGKGGKGISGDTDMTVNGGSIRVITTGTTYTYSSTLDAKAKGIKVDGNITFNGGTTMVRATGDSGSEGIESKAVITINGGTVMSYSYDDAINSRSDLVITGGNVYACGLQNDGLDANGNVRIQGGTVVAYGTTAPEEGIDANTEEGYKLYITGGTVLAAGGSYTAPASISGAQPVLIYSGTISSGTEVSIKDTDSNTIFSGTIDRAYNSASYLFSAPGLTSGATYTLYGGSSSLASFTAATPYVTYGNASGGIGGGQQGGGQQPGGMGGQPGGMGRH